MPTGIHADYRIVERGDNGEFLTWARLALVVEDEVVDIVEFRGSSEFPGEDAVRQAVSYGEAFVETVETPIEERLGPWGVEWEREHAERLAETGGLR